jgi:glycosyltransferase involved in cell wall biosynthesis
MLILRVAYVRSSLLKGSGMLNHILEIAKRIKQAQNEVAIISREAEVKLQDFPVYKMRFAGDKVPFFRNLVFPAKSLGVLEKFDLVHTQYHPDIFVGNAAAELLNKPHVFTYHGFAPIRAWNSGKQRLKMIDHRLGTFFALRAKVSKIITVSQFLKRELVQKYLVDKNLIRVIYNGVDTERFSPYTKGLSIRRLYNIENRPVVLYLGRLAPYKGVHFLIQAIPDVLKELPETKFLISGAMRYDVADLGQLIQRLKVGHAITFTRYVPDEYVPKLYACCDVFCYPSLWEGFGLTPAEAQACGKPVVAFNTCALPEVVENNKTGLLVERRNVEALAEALISLLSDDDRRWRMGLEARKKVLDMFSWDKAAKETLQIYREAIS